MDVKSCGCNSIIKSAYTGLKKKGSARKFVSNRRACHANTRKNIKKSSHRSISQALDFAHQVHGAADDSGEIRIHGHVEVRTRAGCGPFL